MWRLRVGEYRVLYSVSDDKEIVIVEGVRRRTTQTYE